MGSIIGMINDYLKPGFDLNTLIKVLLGIDFFYFKQMALIESAELIFLRFTPGLNISWGNTTAPEGLLTPGQMLDLTGFGQLLSNLGAPTDKGVHGIE